MPAFIVAEAGVNHLGDRAKMLAFCDAAKACGADAVKFQAYNTRALIERRNITDGKTRALLRKAELSDADLDAIAEHCKAIGFKWFASVFDPSQVERVLSRGACALKIGHAEARYDELIDTCLHWRTDVWVSNRETEQRKDGFVRGVHCVEEYPATSKPALVLVDAMEDGGPFCGFSSHYQDWRIPAAAGMRGAEYIEAHVKLADNDEEAAWSLSVEDFGKMSKQIREFESWL
jgi:sialic acid synthase SpsE